MSVCTCACARVCMCVFVCVCVCVPVYGMVVSTTATKFNEPLQYSINHVQCE